MYIRKYLILVLMLFSIITPTQHLVAGGGQGEFEIPGTDFDDAIYLAY